MERLAVFCAFCLVPFGLLGGCDGPKGKATAINEKAAEKKADEKGDEKKAAAVAKPSVSSPGGNAAEPSGNSVKPTKPTVKKEESKKTDPATLAAYWKGMNEGRKATLAKKYEDAYAAFDKALVAIADDARAISERGYAKLLAKQYKAAVVDLDKAARRTSDKKILGQIYYNYGLAAEGQGEAESARAAFSRSYAFNPTPAAKAKIDGKSACTATINDKMPSSLTEVYDTWQKAYEAIQKDRSHLLAWSAGASMPSWQDICQSGWTPAKACIASLGQAPFFETEVFLPRGDGKIVEFNVDMVGGRCGGDIEARITSDGNIVHVWWTSRQGLPIAVTEKKGEMVPCGEKDESCMTACGGDSLTFGDMFIAKDSGVSKLFVYRDASATSKDPLTLSSSVSSVNISGGSCDQVWPLK